ncbi:Uncharacterised protein [Mycobacteroides abscessus subsp. abscessus]|nr:Uncharacterised protein [Mycobacteroides abscessus subsp. abscessus]
MYCGVAHLGLALDSGAGQNREPVVLAPLRGRGEQRRLTDSGMSLDDERTSLLSGAGSGSDNGLEFFDATDH